MRLYVYKHPTFKGCSNRGISETCDLVTIVNLPGMPGGMYEPSAEAPAVILEQHVRGCVRLVPAELIDGKWQRKPGPWMAGGAFVGCSDSRFSGFVRRLLGVQFYGAVALHDRTESAADMRLYND